MNTRVNGEVQRNVVGRHAVVLGGSLAGLLAARVLADHFDRVTLIERDASPETSEVRKGIPQANHVHGLLLRRRCFVGRIQHVDTAVRTVSSRDRVGCDS